jgi:hypothetical protein
LDGVNWSKMHLLGIATLSANYGSSGGDAIPDGHRHMVRAMVRRRRFEAGNSGENRGTKGLVRAAVCGREFDRANPDTFLAHRPRNVLRRVITLWFGYTAPNPRSLKMSFQCDFCGKTVPLVVKGDSTPPGSRPVLIVTQRVPNKTGTGMQIKKEKKACPDCAKSQVIV